MFENVCPLKLAHLSRGLELCVEQAFRSNMAVVALKLSSVSMGIIRYQYSTPMSNQWGYQLTKTVQN